MPLSDVFWVEMEDFSFETHWEFQRALRRMKSVTKEVVNRLSPEHFEAPSKIHIDSKKWDEIYRIIEKSREKRNFKQPSETQITTGFLWKRYLVSGDKWIVIFGTAMLEWGITSVSDNRVDTVLGEVETKIFWARWTWGINLLRTKTEILENGWELRYAGVLYDNYLDRKDLLLKQNWGRQLRTRWRFLNTGEITETLTLKRKITDMSPDQILLMQHLMEEFWQKTDFLELQKIKKYIKILLEEEDDINDMEWLESSFEVLRFYIHRAKIKLRASYLLKSSKLELEHYPLIDAQGTKSWFMRPFVEQESTQIEEAAEIRRLLGLHGDGIKLSSAWSEWAFEFDGAWASYLRFWEGWTKDSRVHTKKDRIFRQAMRLMQTWWYFDNFRY